MITKTKEEKIKELTIKADELAGKIEHHTSYINTEDSVSPRNYIHINQIFLATRSYRELLKEVRDLKEELDL